ncbi:MAG: MinD/ParA family protein [Magnetococcales bacterium]|nr:MinD/ParA family protein [Magnetococcales bacterium]
MTMIDDLDNQVATLKELARQAELKRLAAERGNSGSWDASSAEGRNITQRKVPYTMAVTSGKGGVGKTLVSVNLAVNFARRGLKVLVIDADLGLANIDVVLGLSPTHTIQDVLEGHLTLDQVAIKGPYGITILPAASGVADLSELSDVQRMALTDHIDNWNADFDVVLVDTGAGISPNVRYFILAVEKIMVVATPDPASVTDAYALMKVMYMNHRIARFDLLVNQVSSEKEALDVFRTLHRVADKFLNITLDYQGFIPADAQLKQAVRQQLVVSEAFPEAPASIAFDILTSNLVESWHKSREDQGRMTFFWRRLLKEEEGSAPTSEETE